MSEPALVTDCYKVGLGCVHACMQSFVGNVVEPFDVLDGSQGSAIQDVNPFCWGKL